MSYLEPIQTVTEARKAAPDFNCGWSFTSYLVRMSAQKDKRESSVAVLHLTEGDQDSQALV